MASSPQLTEELALLEALPAFELFEREALQIIAFSSDVRQMRAGDTVFKMGQISDCGYLILSGAITLDDGTPLKGKNAAIFDRGHLLGAQALFAPTERPATAIVREDCQVMRISRSLVFRVLETFPETARRLRDRVAMDANETVSIFGRVLSVINRDYQPDEVAA